MKRGSRMTLCPSMSTRFKEPPKVSTMEFLPSPPLAATISSCCGPITAPVVSPLNPIFMLGGAPEAPEVLSVLAQNIERNSDAHLPITVIVVDSNAVNLCPSPGGY